MSAARRRAAAGLRRLGAAGLRGVETGLAGWRPSRGPRVRVAAPGSDPRAVDPDSPEGRALVAAAESLLVATARIGDGRSAAADGASPR